MTCDSFRDGVALVTGAASGIGREVVLQLLAEGAKVAAFDRAAAGLSDLVAQVAAQSPSLGARLLTQVSDVTDGVTIEPQVARVEAVMGPVRWLVSGAGILCPGGLLEEGCCDALRGHFSVHVEGLCRLMGAVAPRMLKRGEGSVVAVSSNAGAVPRIGMGAYSVSKAAETMLMKCYALELAPLVRCNVVSPGSTETPMLQSLIGDQDHRRLIAGDGARYKLGIPLGRVAKPADIAEAVLFLLSPAARHITGHDLRVDGGATP